MTKPISIPTREMLKRIDNPDHRIIDVRPIAAYNGWALNDEPRGGHINGAKSIPHEWTRYMDWVEVLSEKGIKKDQPVTLYGYEKDKTNDMAKRLLDLGYDDISVYHHFMDEWSPEKSLPMDHLARYEQLVYPEWIKMLISQRRPPEYKGGHYVICHAHYDIIEDYNQGHIPGAIPLNTNDLESTETWNRHEPEVLREKLQQHGIRHDTTVIVYGRFSHPRYDHPHPGKSAGHLGAIRCAAILLWAGVEDVRILNGGITSWENAGYKLSTKPTEPKPVKHFGADIPGRPDLMIDTPEAKKLLSSKDGALVSVRSWREFIGEWSGYHYIEKSGRIPGAVFGNCGTDAYHMENYRNFDHTMREYQEVAEKWREGGIIPEKHVAFYCGTGWRGSEAFMNAWLMGWPRVSVYDGGWFEWSNDPDNPIETGEPAKVFGQ